MYLACDLEILLQLSPDNKTINGTCQSGLNNEQVLLMRLIYIEKCILVQKQVILIVRMVLIMAPSKKRGYIALHMLVRRSVGSVGLSVDKPCLINN